MHYITEAKKENEFSEKKDNIFFLLRSGEI